MAYYSSTYYESSSSSYLGENYQTPYGGNYDIVPSQPLMAYSSYEFSNQNYCEYNSTPYYGSYDSAANRSVISYSASSFSEPKSVVYDPYSDGSYSYPVTQFRISYSVSEFNEPEYEEYDSTPYDGGYDLVLTYGKPLPPSEEACYPHSVTKDSDTLSGFDYAAIGSPYGKQDVDESAATTKPRVESKKAPTNEDVEKPVVIYNDDYKHYSDDYPPWSSRGSGYNEGDSYEYNRRVNQVPSGYGLEAMDVCEGLFGYWPCLARNKNRCQNCGEIANDESSSSNQWKDTADYLFGSSDPYGERRNVGGGSYGDVIYGYERHYQEEPLYRQFDCDEGSLVHKFTIY